MPNRPRALAASNGSGDAVTKNTKPPVHLVVAPEGWVYSVTLAGPGGARFTIEPKGGGETYEVRMDLGDGHTQTTAAEDIQAGIKMAQSTAKRLNKAAEQRRVLHEAERAALKGFTSPPPRAFPVAEGEG